MPVTLLQPGQIKILPHMTEYEVNRINTIPAKEYILDWFRKRIPAQKGGVPIIKPTTINDRVMILQSGTGSGKSVTLGPEFYINFHEATRRNIAVTQPRVLTAMSIPVDDIAPIEPFIKAGIKLGANLGYQTGHFIYKPVEGIVFMTDGVLSQQLKVMSDEEFMQKYAFIVIDECHIRSLAIDLLFSLIKKFMNRNYKKSECPFLILTSATFDTKKYADYFGVDHKNIITVKGSNHPIEHNYLKVPVADYIQASANRALKIHTENIDDYKSENKFTDILIFVYGSAPTKNIRKILEDANNKLKDNHFVLITLTGRTAKDSRDVDYRNIFKPLSSIDVLLSSGKIVTPVRRIIISTDVAETGVTIDTLKYLIDTGFANFVSFNPIYGTSVMIPKDITQASSLQRKGRVGRRAPGVYYPMYTKKLFDKMQKNKYPEFLTKDITESILGLIIKTVHPSWDGVVRNDVEIEDKFDIMNIGMMDEPSVDSLSYSIEKLFVLGLIDANFIPTPMGLSTVRLNVIPLEVARMILAGYQQGANIISLITIGAFMTLSKRDYIDDMSKNKYSYVSIFKKNQKTLHYYNKFFIADDFIETVFIWEDFMENIEIMKKKLSINYITKWCTDNGLHYEGLLSVISIRDEIIASFIQSIGLDPFHTETGVNRYDYSLKKIFQKSVFQGMEEVKKIKRCIYEGFRLNVASWDNDRNAYIMEVNKQKVRVESDVVKPIIEHKEFKQRHPFKIICREVNINKHPFNDFYIFVSDRVSVVDGYINTDNTFVSS
tara:strand:- start:354 stop:2678 length:2325 start_codon:yes stop_codon:yes gene_type:complete